MVYSIAGFGKATRISAGGRDIDFKGFLWLVSKSKARQQPVAHDALHQSLPKT